MTRWTHEEVRGIYEARDHYFKALKEIYDLDDPKKIRTPAGAIAEAALESGVNLSCGRQFRVFHNMADNSCGLAEGEVSVDFQCGRCHRFICQCFYADDLPSGPVCCDCWSKL